MNRPSYPWRRPPTDPRRACVTPVPEAAEHARCSTTQPGRRRRPTRTEAPPLEDCQGAARCPLAVDDKKPPNDAKDQRNDPPDNLRLPLHSLLPCRLSMSGDTARDGHGTKHLRPHRYRPQSGLMSISSDTTRPARVRAAVSPCTVRCSRPTGRNRARSRFHRRLCPNPRRSARRHRPCRHLPSSLRRRRQCPRP